MRKLTPEQMREFIEQEKKRFAGKIATKWAFQPNAIGNVIILHGYRGHVRAPHFKDLANALYDAGFNVGSCDLPNFGKSEPEDPRLHGQILSFAVLVRVAKYMLYCTLEDPERGNMPTIFIGYSLGALVIKRLFQIYLQLQRYVDAVVLVAIPLRVDQNARKELLRFKTILRPVFGLIARLWPHMSVAKYEPDEFSVNDPHHYKGDMDAWTAYQILVQADKAREKIERFAVATLYVHGEDDTTAPLEAMEWAYGKIATRPEDKQKIVYKATGHLVLQQQKQAISDIVNWVTTRVKLPTAPHPTIHPEIGLIQTNATRLFELAMYAISELTKIALNLAGGFLRRLRVTARIWFRTPK